MKNIKPIRMHSIKTGVVYLACVLIVIALLMITPLSRQVGLTMRYDFFIPLIVFLAVIFPLFMQSNNIIKAASFIMTLIVFALPLSGLWASGQSEQYLLGGIIPFSDSRGYFADTRSLVEGGEFFTSHSRRPLFSAFFAPILALTNNHLQLSLAFLMLFSAVACYLAAREIQSSMGTLPAVFVLVLLFFFFRLISGKVLSEALGFPLAILGLTFFLHSARQNNLVSAFYGLFLVSVALVARAGAFFILPALVVWIFWQFHGGFVKNLKIVLFCSAAVALAFAINSAIHSIFVSSSHPSFGNFAYTFYGLAAGGKGWQQILVDYPQIGSLPEPAYTQKIFELAFEVIKRKPMNLLVGAYRSWAMFFATDDYYSLFNWVSGSRPIVGTISRLGLYALMVVGIIDFAFAAISRRLTSIHKLILLTALGIVLSVPLAPPLDANRIRIYASVIPFLLLLPAAGLSFLMRWKRLKFLIQPRESFSSIGSSFALSGLLLAILVVGPFLTRVFARPLPEKSIECLPGQSSVTIRLSPGSLVNLTDPEIEKKDWLPNIRLNTFITRAHNLPNWETFPLFDNLPHGKTLANETSLTDDRIILFIADTSSLPPLPALIQSCGEFSDDRMVREYNVFFADSIVQLDQ